jgi:preprotein translocase subunit SecE
MSTKTDATPSSNKLDTLKWLLVLLLLSTGVVGFYYFSEHSLLLRVVSLLGVVGLAIFIALQTEKGRRTKNFLQQTQIEVRKVVWPTRQETVQMTGIVILMVVLVALIIWMLDSLLFWLVRLFTGQGG